MADGNVKDDAPILSTQGINQSGSYHLCFTWSDNIYPRQGSISPLQGSRTSMEGNLIILRVMYYLIIYYITVMYIIYSTASMVSAPTDVVEHLVL